MAERSSVFITHKQVGWWCEECRHVMDMDDPTRCDNSVPVLIEVVAECDFTSLPAEDD